MTLVEVGVGVVNALVYATSFALSTLPPSPSL